MSMNQGENRSRRSIRAGGKQREPRDARREGVEETRPSQADSHRDGSEALSQADRPVILLVDDEEMIILSIRGLLSLDDEYEIFTYTSPREALEWIRANKVDLIVSDYLMPELDGFEFLSEAKKAQPNAIRILLTGYADKENAIRAINELGLFRYVEKPWQNDDLVQIIRKGAEKRMLLKRLRDAVENVGRAREDLLEVEKEINFR